MFTVGAILAGIVVGGMIAFVSEWLLEYPIMRRALLPLVILGAVALSSGTSIIICFMWGLAYGIPYSAALVIFYFYALAVLDDEW